MNLEDLLHQQAEGADLRSSSLDQITKRAGRIRRRRAAAGIAGVAAAVVIVAGGVVAVNVGTHPSSVAPASGGPSPEATATEVDNTDTPTTTLLDPGHDVDHTTAASPEVPWLWQGVVNLPDGTLVTPSDTTRLLKNAQILTYAAAPDQPGLYYAIANLGNGNDPEMTMFGGGDGFEPEPTTTGGLVTTPDGSKLADLYDEVESRGPGSSWKLRLHSAGSDIVTWALPEGMDSASLVGILPDGTVVLDASGIYVAAPNDPITQLPIVGAPDGASGFSATSVSSTELAVTFTVDGTVKSCWGTASATTGALKAYTCDGGVDPTFSPDGSKIVTLRNIDVAVPGQYNLATIYDTSTLHAIRTFSTTGAAASGDLHAFFGPSLVWDRNTVLASTYDSYDNGTTQGWTLVWLNPAGNPDYQYARSLIDLSKATDPQPFVFAADALRATE